MQLHRLLWMDRLVGSMGDLAPYAALGFALPGGSLIALALWAARHHPMATLTWRRVRALMIVVVAVFATAQTAFANSGIVPGDLSRAELLSPVTLCVTFPIAAGASRAMHWFSLARPETSPFGTGK